VVQIEVPTVWDDPYTCTTRQSSMWRDAAAEDLFLIKAEAREILERAKE
jgi:hypothetical protein